MHWFTLWRIGADSMGAQKGMETGKEGEVREEEQGIKGGEERGQGGDENGKESKGESRPTAISKSRRLCPDAEVRCIRCGISSHRKKSQPLLEMDRVEITAMVCDEQLRVCYD